MVMYQSSVVASGIEKKIGELGYHVIPIVGDLDLAQQAIPDATLVVTYLPGDIIDDSVKLKSFSGLVEAVVSSEKNMLCIGEPKDHEALIANIPELVGLGWVNRPIDMDNLESLIERTMAMERVSVYSGEKKRILIVDDDPSYAKMVREWIKDKYRVDIVTAGMQAISFLLKVKETDKVDLILLDYEMPVVDGSQVLQMLRQEPSTKDIPVVFLTGNGTKEAVSRVMELKPEGYILKSTTRKDLLSYLKSKIKQ